MKYTTTEICEIIGVTQSQIGIWIKEGISSCHPMHKGEKVKLKAELVSAGGRRGGKYYLIDANDLNDFMTELYYTSYFYKWWRK